MNILIAEDNRVIQEITESLMDMWDFEYDLAMNGQEAVDFATVNEGKYDLCLMDIDMPKMNGLEATGIIRQRLKYLPIMAMTGNSGYKRKCIKAGMDDFITKPYDLDRLHDKIKELTVKAIKIRIDHNKIILDKEMPMDAEHAKELRELEKRGLCKMSLRGALNEVTMVVHKNVPQKISHDFIGDDKQLSIFLDRSNEKPGECYLYRINFLMNTRFLSQQKLEEKIKAEDEFLKDCNTFAEKKKET